MRLDPKKVRFVAPFTTLGVFGDTVRFVDGPKTVQLQETALVVEGNVLKVGLLGAEALFRAALAEWSSVTVPYARIARVKYSRFPLGRQIALLVCLAGPAVVVAGILSVGWSEAFTLAAVGAVLVVPAVYAFARIPPRFMIDFQARGGRRTRIMLQITDRRLRAEFAARLAEYREAAAKYARPDPADARVRTRLRVKVAVGAAVLVVAAILGLVAMYLAGEAIERFKL